jgi:endonuclease/exonuclease/phosphatase family metal-dependent hydrolase
MRWIFLIVAFLIQSAVFSQDSLIVVSYNVENLFDYEHDTLKNDSSFLPEGNHHWTYHRYQTKLDRIAQVIVNIGGWESAMLVGLCEVENERCLRDLCYRLKRFHYKYVHYESGDERGVDVALLYDSTKVKVLDSKPLFVSLNGDMTRDILFVEALVGGKDTLYTMVCHLPSKLGGSAATEWKRKAAKQVILQQVDSILKVDSNASIVVLGDMNADPKDDLQGMNNLMIGWERVGKGTHKHQGMWSCLDQIYVSDALKGSATATVFSPNWLLDEDTKYLDYQPKRTYVGYRYKGGYSDHLPIVLKIRIAAK